MAQRAKGDEAEVETGKSIEGFAEDLGRILGHARNKAEGWLGQRTAIIKQLIQLRDEASSLLSRLGHGTQAIVRIGRPTGSKNAAKPAGTRKRRKMSAKARAAISAAQKARWAKKKAGEKK